MSAEPADRPARRPSGRPVSRRSDPDVVPVVPSTRLDVSWMDHAACVSKTYLPWTAEPAEVSEFQQRAMRAVCGTCPVLDTCQGYASARDVDAGYWAGRARGPQPPPFIVPLLLERPETFEERAARVNTLKEARRRARHLTRHRADQAQRARQASVGYGS